MIHEGSRFVACRRVEPNLLRFSFAENDLTLLEAVHGETLLRPWKINDTMKKHVECPFLFEFFAMVEGIVLSVPSYQFGCGKRD